ncbi:DegV family protein [Clostridium sediminicola]|uniref:DegV family protein n=1 Tax=Clostridium sediminicola TaxID=3114879 RepID=UPI0031F1E706
MSNYKIITDSTSDLSLELVSQMDVHIIPMIYTIDGKDYHNTVDEKELSSHDFYNLMRKGKNTSTVQINGEIFKNEVRQYLDAGLNILYLVFSSGLSGTYNSVKIASEDLKEEYPERKIIIVDTLAASMGEGLLVYYADELYKQGKTIEETSKWVEDNKLNLAQWFTVDDLHFLNRGGRVSTTAAVVGTLLSIKPVLHVDDEGHLIMMEKVRGRKQSLKILVDHMEKVIINPEKQTIFISHGDCPKDCEYVKKLIKERFGIEKMYSNTIGPVIGSHSGPNTIALFFLGEKR